MIIRNGEPIHLNDIPCLNWDGFKEILLTLRDTRGDERQETEGRKQEAEPRTPHSQLPGLSAFLESRYKSRRTEEQKAGV